MSAGSQVPGTSRLPFAAAAVAALLLWLVGYPLLLTVWEALDGGSTLEHFRELATNEDEWTALGRSLWISLASVVLAALVGVPLAFVFERTDFPGRRILGALMALPVALPPLVVVISCCLSAFTVISGF